MTNDYSVSVALVGMLGCLLQLTWLVVLQAGHGYCHSAVNNDDFLSFSVMSLCSVRVSV